MPVSDVCGTTFKKIGRLFLIEAKDVKTMFSMREALRTLKSSRQRSSSDTYEA